MKKAFTLAEVLITLGIIGVVAALVMPGVIGNYQKRTWVAQLQKGMNTWNNSMEKMLADDGVEYLNDTEFVRSAVDAGNSNVYMYYIAQNNPDTFNIFKKHFNITYSTPVTKSINYLKGAASGNNFTYTIKTPDNVWYDVGFYYLNNSSSDIVSLKVSNGQVIIDVNGPKGPNTYGRDIFWFYLDAKGNLVPEYSSQSNETLYPGYWKDNPVYCGTAGSSDVSMADGTGCAARIMEEGWVMDY